MTYEQEHSQEKEQTGPAVTRPGVAGIATGREEGEPTGTEHEHTGNVMIQLGVSLVFSRRQHGRAVVMAFWQGQPSHVVLVPG